MNHDLLPIPNAHTSGFHAASATYNDAGCSRRRLRSPIPVPASASSDSGASTDTSTGTPTNPSSGFPCPASDKSGAAVAARTQTVVDDITTVTCTYPGTTGTCIYNGNGVFQLGSSGCPGAPTSSSLSISPSSTTTTTTSSQPTNNSNDSHTNTPASNSSSRLTPAAIAGIASGTTIVVLLFLLLGVCVFRERRCKRKHEVNKTAIAIKEGGTGYQSASVYINSQGLQVQAPLLPVGALAPFTYSYTLETGPPVGPEKGRLGPGETGKRFR
ncbi:hypothetical protein C8F01DRAFT_1375102 [Mycena amicta]|nr:hypothetical protein C8F01DRAFT_1375102 [Mycena amicta]